ncbi:MAG: response regulator [Deltaproteobacteria bacterium]|nr:response regulator [Deltaproteobacteria bacterium]
MNPSPTILVVDDNRAVLAALKSALEEASFKVLTADDGDRAVGIIVKQKPDLIISDIQMPNLDGFFLCQIVRSRPETRTIPFIFLTALDAPPKRAHGFKIGADDFIPKPFDREEVVMRVKNVLKKATASQQPTASTTETSGPKTETVRGNVAEFPLSDLLQMVNLNQKTGRIHLVREGASQERGSIEVAPGVVVSATAGRQIGLKGFCRLFTWRDATFQVEYSTTVSPAATASPDIGPIEELTMTALFQRIEFEALVAKLGGLVQDLEEDPEHEVPESEIDANGKYLLLLVQRHRTLATVIEESGLTDLDTLKSVGQLVSMGVLRRVA